MTKPFALQTFLDLMQIRTDEATRNLAHLIANEKDARAKLELLQHYRDEYATRFRESAQKGLTQREWSNFQQFLNRLDEAIDVAASHIHLDHGIALQLLAAYERVAFGHVDVGDLRQRH